MENKVSLPECYKITYKGGSGEIVEKNPVLLHCLPCPNRR